MPAEPQPQRSARAQTAIPISLGLVAFFVVTGGRSLNPRNIAWLSKGDPATYFLGWHFFRTTPWGWPLGVNPRYGAEVGSAIAFIDNVPLFAFPFKLIGRFLPTPFQYFGIWTLCCFVLQAWFGWLLVGLVTRVPFARACGCVLFVFAPPFLWRLQGHYQMEGQWLVLAALYICFGPRRLARGAAWPLLALTVALVHSYMTAMVLGLWLSDWLRRVLFEERTRAELVQPLLVPGLVLLGFWQAGLFTVGNGIVKHGFGEYKMNLLSLVDPSGWSYLLKDIPESDGEYEGFNFLGLGGILLALAVAPALKRAWPALRAKQEYWPLLGLLSGLTLFAISNRIGFATHTLELPLSKAWIARANLLRGCGRMFWPVFYALFFLLVRTLFKQYPPRVAALMLFVVVLVQTVDTSAGWRPIRRDLMIQGETWDSPLRSAFWAQVPSLYQVIRVVPTGNQTPHYADFAYFAAMHGMSTDAVYLARIAEDDVKEANRRGMLAVKRARYESGAVYILNPRFEAPATRSVNPDRDLLAWKDGFLVLAPGWKCRPQCSAAASALPEDCSATCAQH